MWDEYLSLSTKFKCSLIQDPNTNARSLSVSVTEGHYPYDTCNPGLVNEGWTCNEDNLCWYGCDKGYCWSQCNG